MNWSELAYRLVSELAGPKERELIGELAVEEEKITPSQLEECLREQREAKGEDQPRLGDLLVRKGHLTPGELAALLERQTDEAGLHDPAWRYEIREPIGRGATAVVYRAWDRELRRDVALKVLEEQYATRGKRKAFEAFRLFCLDPDGGSSYGEISSRLGISRKDVDNYIYSARRDFRRAVADTVRQYISDPDLLEEELRCLFGGTP